MPKIKKIIYALSGLVASTILVVVVAGWVASLQTAEEPKVTVSSEPMFFPNGSATQNLPIFTEILEQSGAGKPNHDLVETFVLLARNGFNIDDITHTSVVTKTGGPAESVSVAIKFKGECLIAQFSPTWLTTTVADETASGCLIGDVTNASLETAGQD